jgi:uncharacterized protein (DUF427 family)
MEASQVIKSPGHQKWPDHKVQEVPLERATVRVGGALVADSSNVIRVDEDEQPARYYLPRADVKMSMLERSDKTTQCPFKGTARYFNLRLNGETLQEAVWSYEDPYEEHRALKDRLAFHEEKIPGIRIEPKS